jgi:hypothetical protein
MLQVCREMRCGNAGWLGKVNAEIVLKTNNTNKQKKKQNNKKMLLHVQCICGNWFA